MAGTIGALIERGGALYVLSNNHVLAAGNQVPVGMPILAPSSIDSGPGRRAPLEIARHSEICELRSGDPTLVVVGREDVALARVTDPTLVSSWQGDDAEGFDSPSTIASPVAGMRVKKVGRTTGLTQGTVESLVNNPFVIPYVLRLFRAPVWFRDMWTVRDIHGDHFALPGDSGSLVVTDDGQAAVGLIFAVGPGSEYGIMIPMTHISTLFGGLALVSGHGV